MGRTRMTEHQKLVREKVVKLVGPQRDSSYIANGVLRLQTGVRKSGDPETTLERQLDEILGDGGHRGDNWVYIYPEPNQKPKPRKFLTEWMTETVIGIYRKMKADEAEFYASLPPAKVAWKSKYSKTKHGRPWMGVIPILADALQDAGCEDHELLEDIRKGDKGDLSGWVYSQIGSRFNYAAMRGWELTDNRVGAAAQCSGNCRMVFSRLYRKSGEDVSNSVLMCRRCIIRTATYG